jgi:hypothetical protein
MTDQASITNGGGLLGLARGLPDHAPVRPALLARNITTNSYIKIN